MHSELLFDLLSWMSPSWPVGAFAHSSGLEWAVEAGFVHDRASVQAWLEDWVTIGGGWTDALLFAFAHRTASCGDQTGLLEIAELALALASSAERRVETTAQGMAFRRIARAAAPHPALGLLDPLADEDLAYPVAAACLMAGRKAPLISSLVAYSHGAVANLASAAQRLIPLGQTDGQIVIAALRAPVMAAALRAEEADSDDPFEAMGAATFMADFAAIAHETQYTRLFRT